MNAQELHKLTAPLFEKHPRAKPDGITYLPIPCDPSDSFWHLEDHAADSLTDSLAAIIIQGHIVEWLKDFNISSPEKARRYEGWIISDPHHYVKGTGETLLEALVAACMEVPCSL